MKTFVPLIVLVAVLSGVWARPQRAHREANCADIDYRPFVPSQAVCGSDGRTYVNEKHVHFENCVNNAAVTVESEGWCEEDTQGTEFLKDLMWQVVSMFVVEIGKDMSAETTQELATLLDDLANDDDSGDDGSASAEALTNFLKGLVGDSSGSMERIWKFLESLDLDSSEEKNNYSYAASEENNEIPNVLMLQ